MQAAHNIGPSIEGLAQELQRRGPDGVRHLSIPLADVSNTEPGGAAKPKHPSLQFIGAELQLRGEEVVRQPLEDGHGNVLVFNGEGNIFFVEAIQYSESPQTVAAFPGNLRTCSGRLCQMILSKVAEIAMS